MKFLQVDQTPPYGPVEASRILAHILKDKLKKPEYAWDRNQDWEDFSGFMITCCNEALEAMEAMGSVKTLKKKSRSDTMVGYDYENAPPNTL